MFIRPSACFRPCLARFGSKRPTITYPMYLVLNAHIDLRFRLGTGISQRRYLFKRKKKNGADETRIGIVLMHFVGSAGKGDM